MTLAELVRNPDDIRGLVEEAKSGGKSVGLVPTMGDFHQGHLELMRTARRECDLVVVSLFVNPAQFGLSEDLDRYPRDLERDLSLAGEVGVDYVFAPLEERMYTEGYQTYVEVEDLTRGLCGGRRPGHFRGVTTVVAKLFNIVSPHTAYFGQKDAQQAVVVRRMAKDLDFPVDIRVVPTVREEDGLAMSSRNRYLAPDERKSAAILYEALESAKKKVMEGEKRADAIRSIVEETVSSEPSVELEYIAICDNISLRELETLKGDVLIALAANIGTARLIDNVMLRVSDG